MASYLLLDPLAARGQARRIFRRAVIGVALALAIAASPAATQEIGGYPLANHPAANPDVNAKPPTEHLWHGADSPWPRLDNAGLDLTLQYTGESGSIVDGGNRRGTDFAGQVALAADADFGTMASLTGVSAHAAIVHRHGRSASADYLGDNLFQVQEIYGGGGGVAGHLVYAYGEVALGHGAIDIEAGRLPVAHDFASSPLYGDDLSTIVCGSPHALPGEPAFTVYPNSAWGGRVRIKAAATLAVQAGVYQVRPKFGGSTGFNFGGSGETGAYFPVELDCSPKYGRARLPGHYKLGFIYDTSDYADPLTGADGSLLALSGAPARRYHGRASGYALADQMVARTGKGPTDGIILSGGYIRFDERTSTLEYLAFGGVHAAGLVPGRAHDAVNLLAGYARTSSWRVQAEEIDLAAGLPLPGGIAGIQSHEIVLEANYNIHIVEGLHLAPDVQYVDRPGATAAKRSALSLGLKVDVIL